MPNLTNPISRRDIERATENGNAFFAQLAKQLLATMRENERLRDALMAIDKQAMLVIQDDVPHYGYMLRCGWIHEVCTHALSNEISENEK